MKGFLGASKHRFVMQGPPLWDPRGARARQDPGWEHRALPNRHPLTSSRGSLPSSRFLHLLGLEMAGRNSPGKSGKGWQ